jgi:hypothetical protein
MISMRYARNLAEGHGLVWNAGQAPVEGYTNFFWTLWMACLHLLRVPESKTSLLVMLSGMLILAANLVIVRRIAERLAPDSPLVASLSLWFTALYYPLIYWTLRGMEVGLLTLMISTSVLMALRLRDRFRYQDLVGLASVMALGVLTRPDMVVPCVVISAYVLGTARAPSRSVAALVLVGAVGGTLAIHTAFRMIYYGAPVPNTYYLKVVGAALGTRLVRGLLGLFVFDLIHLIVPIALSASYLIARRRNARGAGGAWLLAAIFVALAAYSVYVGGDVWDNLQYANRYITPAMPGLLMLSALAIDSLLRDATGRLVGILACLFLLLSFVSALAPITLQDLSVTAADQRLRSHAQSDLCFALDVSGDVGRPFVARALIDARAPPIDRHRRDHGRLAVCD